MWLCTLQARIATNVIPRHSQGWSASRLQQRGRSARGPAAMRSVSRAVTSPSSQNAPNPPRTASGKAATRDPSTRSWPAAPHPDALFSLERRKEREGGLHVPSVHWMPLAGAPPKMGPARCAARGSLAAAGDDDVKLLRFEAAAARTGRRSDERHCNRHARRCHHASRCLCSRRRRACGSRRRSVAGPAIINLSSRGLPYS